MMPARIRWMQSSRHSSTREAGIRASTPSSRAAFSSNSTSTDSRVIHVDTVSSWPCTLISLLSRLHIVSIAMVLLLHHRRHGSIFISMRSLSLPLLELCLVLTVKVTWVTRVTL
jgi:hypothetical protein